MFQHNIDCWEVYSGYDREIRHIAYFETEALAVQYIANDKNKAYMGKNRVKKTYMVFEDLKEVELYSRDNIIKGALAKLSEMEKEALGIKIK